jgi:hypothetical protein
MISRTLSIAHWGTPRERGGERRRRDRRKRSRERIESKKEREEGGASGHLWLLYFGFINKSTI